MRRVLMVILTLSLSACGATVVGETADGIWLREPFIGGDLQAQAADHCRKFGKTAVYAGTLDPTHGFALPVVSYNCQ